MIEKQIENFIVNASYFEVLDYKKEGKTPIVESYEENQWSYIVEIMILTIKSLKPSEKDNGNVIDYKRFKSELELWKSYRHGMNRNLMDGVDGKGSQTYFSEIDETIYSRIAVITLANQNWDAIKSEIIKNTLFSTGNIEMILESLLLAKMLFLILRNKSNEYEEILIELKNEAINFTQVELSNYENYYRVPRNESEKNYKIEFERNRISLISILNNVHMDDKFSILKTCLKILKAHEEQEENNEHKVKDYNNFFIAGLSGLLSGEVISNEVKDIKFIESMCGYTVKLRKGRIDSEGLALKDCTDINVFDYKEGQTFVHPLLNSSQIIYRGKKDQFEVAYVKTRTGVYRFVNLDKS